MVMAVSILFFPDVL